MSFTSSSNHDLIFKKSNNHIVSNDFTEMTKKVAINFRGNDDRRNLFANSLKIFRYFYENYSNFEIGSVALVIICSGSRIKIQCKDYGFPSYKKYH